MPFPYNYYSLYVTPTLPPYLSINYIFSLFLCHVALPPWGGRACHSLVLVFVRAGTAV